MKVLQHRSHGGRLVCESSTEKMPKSRFVKVVQNESHRVG